MIAAFCRAGHLEEAKKLARDYEAFYNKYDLVILNVLLCAYCRASDMECVMQTLGKMDKLAITPDKYTFNILIKYFCKEKLYLLAYRILEDMRNKGHQLEEVSFFHEKIYMRHFVLTVLGSISICLFILYVAFMSGKMGFGSKFSDLMNLSLGLGPIKNRVWF